MFKYIIAYPHDALLGSHVKLCLLLIISWENADVVILTGEKGAHAFTYRVNTTIFKNVHKCTVKRVERNRTERKQWLIWGGGTVTDFFS